MSELSETETDALRVAPDLVQLGLALGPLEVGELGHQHGHGPVAVLELAALVLARHDDAGRQVRQSNRRVGLVHVLPTGAG